MKPILLLCLLLIGTVSWAKTRAHGIDFHSGVPRGQIELIKGDLKYLYQAPVHVHDEDFKDLSQLEFLDGPHLHNWLINRVRYIVGEDFDMNRRRVMTPFYLFPLTPNVTIPDAPKLLAEDETPKASESIKTVMSNMGTSLYLVGKFIKILQGVSFDGENVYARSPRIGLLQVGEGLFSQSMLINKTDPKAISNSINRLGILFHEARHSDGRGRNVGFLHAYCPKGHAYEHSAACDSTANGAYSIGAYAERLLYKNCQSCTYQEKLQIQATLADFFSRILDTNLKKLNDAKVLVEMYNQSLLNLQKELDERPIHREHLENMKQNLEILLTEAEAQVASLESLPVSVPTIPNETEGKWEAISVEQSKAMMRRELR